MWGRDVEECVCGERGVTVCDSTHSGGPLLTYVCVFVQASSSGETESNGDSDIYYIAIKESQAASYEGEMT